MYYIPIFDWFAHTNFEYMERTINYLTHAKRDIFYQLKEDS